MRCKLTTNFNTSCLQRWSNRWGISINWRRKSMTACECHWFKKSTALHSLLYVIKPFMSPWKNYHNNTVHIAVRNIRLSNYNLLYANLFSSINLEYCNIAYNICRELSPLNFFKQNTTYWLFDYFLNDHAILIFFSAFNITITIIITNSDEKIELQD